MSNSNKLETHLHELLSVLDRFNEYKFYEDICEDMTCSKCPVFQTKLTVVNKSCSTSTTEDLCSALLLVQNGLEKALHEFKQKRSR